MKMKTLVIFSAMTIFVWASSGKSGQGKDSEEPARNLIKDDVSGLSVPVVSEEERQRTEQRAEMIKAEEEAYAKIKASVYDFGQKVTKLEQLPISPETFQPIQALKKQAKELKAVCVNAQKMILSKEVCELYKGRIKFLDEMFTTLSVLEQTIPSPLVEKVNSAVEHALFSESGDESLQRLNDLWSLYDEYLSLDPKQKESLKWIPDRIREVENELRRRFPEDHKRTRPSRYQEKDIEPTPRASVPVSMSGSLWNPQPLEPAPQKPQSPKPKSSKPQPAKTVASGPSLSDRITETMGLANAIGLSFSFSALKDYLIPKPQTPATQSSVPETPEASVETPLFLADNPFFQIEGSNTDPLTVECPPGISHTKLFMNAAADLIDEKSTAILRSKGGDKYAVIFHQGHNYFKGFEKLFRVYAILKDGTIIRVSQRDEQPVTTAGNPVHQVIIAFVSGEDVEDLVDDEIFAIVNEPPTLHMASNPYFAMRAPAKGGRHKIDCPQSTTHSKLFMTAAFNFLDQEMTAIKRSTGDEFAIVFKRSKVPSSVLEGRFRVYAVLDNGDVVRVDQRRTERVTTAANPVRHVVISFKDLTDDEVLELLLCDHDD